jgi:hypothetical protein
VAIENFKNLLLALIMNYPGLKPVAIDIFKNLLFALIMNYYGLHRLCEKNLKSD